MVALPQKRWTVEEYLAFEASSEEKHEFIDGEIYSMSGASRAHNLICLNTGTVFNNQLENRPCEAYANEMRVRIRQRNYLYPDLAIVCGEAEIEIDQLETLLNPTVIIEVLSPSTEAYDRGKKFLNYQTIESLQEYLLIAQDEPRIERYLRQADGQWLFSTTKGLEAELKLPSIGCTLALAKVYNKVKFAPEEPQSPTE